MEKIFNFFRFTNQQFNIFETNKILMLNVVNSNGRVTRLQAFTNSTRAEVISCALVEFSEESEHVYKGHQLIHVRSGNIIHYNSSMEAAGVVDNDEMCLIKYHKAVNSNTEFKRAPTQEKIQEFTGNVEIIVSGKSFNIKSNFVRLTVGGLSYIRNFLIQMANESAYIISTGPYADFLIDFFKQKIIGRRKFQQNAVESLAELGFERSRCLYAINLKNKKNVQEKFQSLHQIIRIYGRTGQHHCETLLEAFLEMGFEKEDSLNALRTSDWDATRAVELLCEKQEFSKVSNVVTRNVLQSSSVQHYLTDPEIFMTIIYIVGSGAGSSGIEHNWESTKQKYQNVATVLKIYNDEKSYNVMNNINFN